MGMLRITPSIALDERELEEHFVLSTGPGGQNVNKVESAVQLRFDVAHSRSLPEDVRARLMRLAGHRLTKDGVLVLTGRRFREQERNRADAREKLVALIREAAARPKPRLKTKPSRASKEKGLMRKKTRGAIKKLRARPASD